MSSDSVVLGEPKELAKKTTSSRACSVVKNFHWDAVVFS